MQEVTVIREESQPQYIVELEPGSVFRGAGLDDENWVASIVDVDVLADGRLAITDQLSPDRFLVVSPGVSRGRWIGRDGEGPGEYRHIRFVRVFDNHLHVFDLRNVRRTVLDTKNFETVHTNPLTPFTPGSFRFDGAILDDSSYVVNGSIYDADRAGYVLHLFDGRGELIRSFDEMPVGIPGAPDGSRWLARARDGGVWSVPRWEYRVDLWDVATGTRTRSLLRDADWFPPPSGELPTYGPARPGPPRIDDITEDSEGRLWVLVGVPSDQWASCFVKTPPGSHPEVGEYTLRRKCGLYDTRIEVLDPRTGSILAAANVPQGLVSEYSSWISADRFLYSVEEDAFGFPVVRSWRPVLRPRNVQPGGEECVI